MSKLQILLHSEFTILPDANTIGNIASVASTDWGCAVQIAAAVNIGNQSFVATQTQTLYVDITVTFVPLHVRYSPDPCIVDNYAAGSLWR
ncbi:hypothetical protein JVT61DRAFT_11116 [Boletus reticuloceps]|uniref:Uncharacterized protein n=1 Tax=Boletus reticuloceps TaxID=495285 RepID=A0A8I2YEW3_9AGAM|nr:hypothetical protein JVT61DRAFT_11116 [Boletus reticuloceps]